MIACHNVFNMWPKATLPLPVWPRDTKRLDTPALEGFADDLFSNHVNFLKILIIVSLCAIEQHSFQNNLKPLVQTYCIQVYIT